MTSVQQSQSKQDANDLLNSYLNFQNEKGLNKSLLSHHSQKSNHHMSQKKQQLQTAKQQQIQ
jgi:hypothetical protein